MQVSGLPSHSDWLYPRKRPWYPLYRSLCGPEDGLNAEEKNSASFVKNSFWPSGLNPVRLWTVVFKTVHVNWAWCVFRMCMKEMASRYGSAFNEKMQTRDRAILPPGCWMVQMAPCLRKSSFWNVKALELDTFFRMIQATENWHWIRM